MGRRLNIVFLATMAILAMLQSSSAQTAYVVGDALGWVIPPGGPVAYSTWAANKNFRVGDTLFFNFSNGAHDVARVTRENFNACNSTNPLLLLSNGPANFTLNEIGDHYFLCAFPGHCSAGQRLAINVSAAASSPAPQPSTPTPQPSSPAPQPATSPPASTPQPSAPVPAPQASSPTSPATPPSSSSPPPPTATPPSSSSPSPSTATPPSSTTSPPPPAGDNGATPPPSGNSATSLGVAGLSATFLSFIIALFIC